MPIFIDIETHHYCTTVLTSTRTNTVTYAIKAQCELSQFNEINVFDIIACKHNVVQESVTMSVANSL